MPSRRSRPFFWIALSLLVTAAFSGCSAEAKRAKRLSKADEYFRAGDYAKAEIEYKNVLQQALDPTALTRLGKIYFDQVRLQRAGAYLNKAIELQGGNLETRLAYAQWALAMGRPIEARDSAMAVLERDPKNAQAAFTLANSTTNGGEVAAARARLLSVPSSPAVLAALAMLDLRDGKVKEGETRLEQALQQDPKLPEALTVLGIIAFSRKETDKADKYFATAAASVPPRHSARLQQVQYLLQSQQVDAARRVLDEMIKTTPDYLAGYLYRAGIALTEKAYDDAIALYEKVLDVEPAHPEALMLSAEARLAKGETDKAVMILEKAAANYAGAPEVHYKLGRAYFSTGELTKAAASLSEAVRLKPDHDDATLVLAQVNLQLRNLSPVVSSLKSLLQRKPTLTEAQMLLAEAYRGQGNFADALPIYEGLAQANPQNHELPYLVGSVQAQLRNLPEARKALTRSLELSPEFLPAAEALTDLDLRDKNYSGARSRIDKVLERNPKSATAHALLARVYLAQTDHAKAESELLKALELQADFPAAREMLSRLYFSTKQLEKAKTSLQAAVARAPNDLSALVQLGQVQEQMKDYAGARASYEKILAVNPKYAAALNNLAYLYAAQFGEMDKAQDMAQRARDLMPNLGETADTLGWIMVQRRQLARAVVLLEDAAEKIPQNPEVQYHLGMAYYMTGQEERARTALEQALKASQDFTGHEDARAALSVLAFDISKTDANAKSALEQALKTRPDDPIALSRLAALYEREGNQDKALAAYESALKANPANATAALNAIRIYRSRKENSKALELARSTRQLLSSDGRIAHQLGRLTFENGERAAAVGILQEAARRLSSDPEVLFDLGEAAYSVGQLNVAEGAFRDALAASSTFARAKEATSTLEMMALAREPQKALTASASIAEALRSNPSSVPAIMAQAAADEAKGDAKAARQSYEKALGRFPDFTPAKRGLAIQLATSKEDDKRALELGNKARETYLNDAELAKALGILQFREGNFARAVSLLQDSARGRSTDAELQYYLGMANRQMKNASAAERAFKRALDLGLSGDLAAEARKALAAPSK